MDESNESKCIPRIIWILWFDGWDKATTLHQRCLESWRLYNLSWEVRPICRADIEDLLGDWYPKYEKLRLQLNCLEKFGGFWIPPASESDLLRLMLLNIHGGVWADSTMLCRRPLDHWLPKAGLSGFFAFAPESIDEGLPVMSSFLASSVNHPIIGRWTKSSEDHWLSQERDDLGFFWVHKLFGQLVSTDEVARREWSLVLPMTGEYGVRGPHYFVKYSDKLVLPPTPELQSSIDNDNDTPMWKLTNHEVKLKDVGPESCYVVLLETTRNQARAHALEVSKSDVALRAKLSKLGDGVLGPEMVALISGSCEAMRARLLVSGHDVGCF